MISATLTYNFILCPHRAALDLRGDPLLKDEPNAFVEMLWGGGVLHEEAVLAALPVTCNLKGLPIAQREAETLAAMRRHESLIYQGRIVTGDRVGEPDLLELQPDGSYQVGDIKSGGGFEDEDSGRLKRTYGVQLAHSTRQLEELGLADARRDAFIIDGQQERVSYPLGAALGPRTPQSMLDIYDGALRDLREIAAGRLETLPALGASCKLCCWYSHCRSRVIELDDLSRIPELGRSKRDVMIERVPTVAALAELDVEPLVCGKKTVFPGIGPDTLRSFKARAVLLSSPSPAPYLKKPVSLPVAERAVYFDIETDPFRAGGYTYLHGFYETTPNAWSGTFKPIMTPSVSAADEEEAFARAWAYLKARTLDSVIYYYSPYERVMYRALARRYTNICSEDDVVDLFALPCVIDLYTDVVRPLSEWPLHDKSIKTLAKYLGFNWRDTHPSGAASIQWFDEWVRSGDPAIRQRILDYNEDDCVATIFVERSIRELPVRTQ